MMTKDGLIFKANSLKQGRLQALTRQQLQAQATQNRERRCVAPEHLFELRQAYELYQFHHRQITECRSLTVTDFGGLDVGIPQAMRRSIDFAANSHGIGAG